MNDYDQASRRVEKHATDSFFRFLLTAFAEHLRFERWLDTRTIPFPGDPERTGDAVAELTDLARAAPPWAMPVEFQSEPDADMFGRLLIFLGSLWLQMRPDNLRGSRYQLAAAVINLTGTSASAPTSHTFDLPGPDGLRCSLIVRELYLQTMPATALLERIRTGELSRALLAFIPLMQADDPSVIIASWVELASAEPDERLRAEYGALAKVFAKLSPAADQWFSVLEGWSVKTSPFLDEIRAEERAEAKAEDILQLLRLRFRIEPPADVRTRVQQERDLPRLTRWFNASATLGTWEEFLAEFQRS